MSISPPYLPPSRPPRTRPPTPLIPQVSAIPYHYVRPTGKENLKLISTRFAWVPWNCARKKKKNKEQKKSGRRKLRNTAIVFVFQPNHETMPHGTVQRAATTHLAGPIATQLYGKFVVSQTITSGPRTMGGLPAFPHREGQVSQKPLVKAVYTTPKSPSKYPA